MADNGPTSAEVALFDQMLAGHAAALATQLLAYRSTREVFDDVTASVVAARVLQDGSAADLASMLVAAMRRIDDLEADRG